MLINDQADFMSAEPEDLIVLALNKENNNKILVTHELRVWENGKFCNYIFVNFSQNN